MSIDFAREARNPVEVVIFTEQYRIVGTMYVVPGTRVTDYLVSRVEGNFIPLTDVKVYSVKSAQLFFETKFLNVSVSAIIITYPLSEQVTVTFSSLGLPGA